MNKEALLMFAFMVFLFLNIIGFSGIVLTIWYHDPFYLFLTAAAILGWGWLR